MPSKAISILGCGWLGFPLGKNLVDLGYHVKGSTTTPGKLSVLQDVGILPFLIHCHPKILGERFEEFFQADILFLNIPFKRNLSDPHIYKQQIDEVILKVEQSPIDRLIFASSTSVYPDSIGLVTEDDVFQPSSLRAKVLLEIEQSLLQNKHFRATILRFAGLYGGTRKIGQFLAEKNDIRFGDSPVNLIHLDDCTGIIIEIVRQDIHGQIFNACADEHPTRKELYTQAALKIGVRPPTFMESNQGTPQKIISNRKLKEKLHYQFKHPDPLQSL